MNSDSWLNLDCSVQDALRTILANEGFPNNVRMTVCKGSESGDGYASKTHSISLISNRKQLDLFVKYFPLDNIQHKKVVLNLFNNEGHFYSCVYPALLKFQVDKKVKEPFDNVPKYFCVGETKGVKPVILENLKLKNYDIRERQCRINEEHLDIALKAFGKFHATGFALKDQDYETFRSITDGIKDVIAETMIESGFDKILVACINQFIKILDPVVDKDLLNVSDDLANNLVDFVTNITQYQGDYCTILQGDCWSNNMMFLYKTPMKPSDIKLIDWQIIRVNYPVFDLSYFFYSIATPKMIDNWEHYMRKYYKHFSEHCKNLGSDPEYLYPFEILKDHWKKYSKYGLAMAFMLVKVMLYDKDEAPDIAKSLESETIDEDLFNKKTRHQDVYDQRMKAILRHFVNNKFI